MKTKADLRIALVLLAVACAALAGIAIYFHSLYRADQAAYEDYRIRSESQIEYLTSDPENLAGQISALQSEYQRLTEEKTALEKELEVYRASVEQGIDIREALENQLSDYSGQITDLTDKISELEGQIAEKESDIESLRQQLTAAENGLEHLKELYSQQAVFDVNEQYELINNLIWILRNPPTYTVEIDGEPETDEEGEPVLDEEGNPVIPKITKTYSYSISLYYEDLLSGHKFSWNADTSWHTASLIKLPFTLSVLEAASDYAAEHPEEYEAMMAAYEEYKAGLGEEITESELPPADDVASEDAETQAETAGDGEGGEAEVPAIQLYQGTDYPYDFNKEFAYFASQSWQSGSGKIQNAADGTVYTMAELFQYLLLYSDNVAYYQLKEAYDTVLQRNLVSRLGLDAMSKSLAQISARDGGKILRETYEFLSSGKTYSDFMYDAMTKSGHRVMICSSVSPTVVAHKYGWDRGTYHDMGIVYDEHPYTLTVLTNMDSGSGAINSYIQQVIRAVEKIHKSMY
ncbi:MAG: serine hydrolase [Clostridiales bacterium]|nr:serine hydrolase [Clostridiales bacterium]